MLRDLIDKINCLPFVTMHNERSWRCCLVQIDFISGGRQIIFIAGQQPHYHRTYSMTLPKNIDLPEINFAKIDLEEYASTCFALSDNPKPQPQTTSKPKKQAKPQETEWTEEIEKEIDDLMRK